MEASSIYMLYIPIIKKWIFRIKIYFLGRIVKREREPLREEADQQARHKKFIDLVMKKNLLSVTKGFHFPYS